jgi:hypothetical protein
MEANVVIRPLREADLEAADHVMRLAFGTFLGLPDPLQFMGDRDYRKPGQRCWTAGGVERWLV